MCVSGGGVLRKQHYNPLCRELRVIKGDPIQLGVGQNIALEWVRIQPWSGSEYSPGVGRNIALGWVRI